MADYKNTLHLPETEFPMKANLAQREPETLARWRETDVYGKMIAASGKKGRYLLHDGPPYANGNIHIGTALNKILKDIIIKSKNLQGFVAPYIPGWDCHGLPIEHKVELQLGEKKKTLPAHVIRKICREYANKYLGIQREEFKRLGVLGTWDDPYVSMAPEYEATTSLILSEFVRGGGVTRSKKPIYWCLSCRTALAEAEVEYNDHTSPSLYVRFPLTDEKLKAVFPRVNGPAYVVIWTTTPWTLPDNMAVALHPDYDYALVEHAGEYYVLADSLVEAAVKKFGWSDYKKVGTALGASLEGLAARHPFYDRPSPLVLGGHVTLDTGTGAVHTAPGHGREDYEMGLKYGLEVYSPLDDDGRFLDSVPFFAGLTVFEANPKVIEVLKQSGHLLREEKITHSYPHCWRCKSPVIFRATTQWFITMQANNLRDRALKAIREDVDFIPAWGEDRIYSMIEQRPDWCISRQRNWGVPIVALLCESCGEAWNDPDWMKDISGRFAKHPTGCDYWYEAPIEEIAPANLECPSCKAKRWKKETDILDVWFDSGTSFAAVMEKRPDGGFPADMYLEGSDQHRGWFHSSLLASIGSRGVAPYREVLTHGYVVDGEGRKMSKSLGNVLAPEEVIKKHGAEVLRLWVSSVDYREDIRISDEILLRLVDAYRRIRNTCRYLLGNLKGLTPEGLVAPKDMDPLDRYALDVATRAHQRVQKAYADYEFHKVFHTLHNLCVTDLSAFYLDVLKDRLYASASAGPERRSAQSALLRILLLLVRDMAPILSFTAEEVFSHIPEALRPAVPTVFALQDDADGFETTEEERGRFETLMEARAAVTRAAEPMRKAGTIGHSLDTHVTLHADEAILKTLAGLGTEPRALFIVSGFTLKPLAEAPAGATRDEALPGVAITVERAKGEKCERCWIYDENLGANPNFPGLCPRCTAVLEAGN